MSFQRVWRLRVLKFLHFGGSRNQKKILPGVQLSTKAINVKKPVRYTSIKKAKPKTIADIAKILQQKTKDREQKPEVAFSTEPATPNQYNAGVDSINNILSTSKVHTAPSTFPAKVASTLVEKEPARDVSDREAVAKDAPKKSASMTGACESVPAHDLPQETDVISSYETVALDSKLAFYVTTSIPELDHSVQTYNTANTKVMATPAVLVLEVLEDVLDSTVDCHSTLTPAASEVSSSEAADESHVVDNIISPFGNGTENIVGVEDGEVHGNAPSSINLKEPAVVHTEVLEDKLRTDTVEESPVETNLDEDGSN
ncbi:putative GPI-anchored adhesin-like protein PGA55-like [Triplophysa rosa]|uniref:GPI-anchored adhesin-like protein PGA55-like n=1 Tax=Triplophysa rosa TaxID=992332 RepID=A0A9W7WY75_TRIRA|nr:putative GPI-anchored adhesin-like protein PGA55-like [Triplophysa rosa]